MIFIDPAIRTEDITAAEKHYYPLRADLIYFLHNLQYDGRVIGFEYDFKREDGILTVIVDTQIKEA